MRALSAAGAVAVALTVLASWAWQFLKRLEVESRNKTYAGLLRDPSSAKEVPPPSIFEEATKALSIVVPAYNEESRLQPTLDETLLYLRRLRDRRGHLFTTEVVIVDDGSTDHTTRVAGSFVQKFGFDTVRIVRLPTNKGKGFAVRCGMLIARGQNILFMDADGATNVSDFEKLESELQRIASGDGADALGVVVGSRAHLEQLAVAKRHWYRNFLMRGFHLLVLLATGSAVRDTQCGFKLFSRRAARLLYSNQRLQRWCFDVELLHLAQRLHIPVGEVPVSWTEIAGSKIKPTSILHMSWELLAIFLGYRVLRVWRERPEARPEARS